VQELWCWLLLLATPPCNYTHESCMLCVLCRGFLVNKHRRANRKYSARPACCQSCPAMLCPCAVCLLQRLDGELLLFMDVCGKILGDIRA